MTPSMMSIRPDILSIAKETPAELPRYRAPLWRIYRRVSNRVSGAGIAQQPVIQLGNQTRHGDSVMIPCLI
jgi:hypothetical protein